MVWHEGNNRVAVVGFDGKLDRDMSTFTAINIAEILRPPWIEIALSKPLSTKSRKKVKSWTKFDFPGLVKIRPTSVSITTW